MRQVSAIRLVLLFLAASFSMVFAPPCFPQIPSAGDTTSTPIPGAGHDYIHGPVETVNPSNGSISIHIPVIMPPGRGVTLRFNFAYDSNGANYLGTDFNGNFAWQAANSRVSKGGWSNSAPILSYSRIAYTVAGALQDQTCALLTSYVFQDPRGNRHNLGLSIFGKTGQNQQGDCSEGASAVTQGGEGPILATTTLPSGNLSSQPVWITDADGTVFSFPPLPPGSGTYLPASVVDRNGNTITITQGTYPSYSFVDTLGRAVLSDTGVGNSPETVTVSGLGASYTLTWISLSAPTFPSTLTCLSGSRCPTKTPGRFPRTVVSRITLPNGQSFTFSYDTAYGMVNKITYPTGGYVRYVWGMNLQSEAGIFPCAPNLGSCDTRYDAPVITDRYVSFNGTTEVLHQHFNYSTTWSSPTSVQWSSKQTTVTTYDLVRSTNFQTIYTYSPGYAPTPPNTSMATTVQISLETTIAFYDPGGALLKTVSKTWGNVRLLASQRTSLPNSQASETRWTYDANEMETEQDDYDFGTAAPPSPPGPLLRKTVTSYATFGTNHIVDKPSSIIVYADAGNTIRMAQTDFAYDQTTPVPTSGIGQHSGGCHCADLTTKSVWVDDSGTNKLITTYTYDDTGQVLTMVDPMGNAPGGNPLQHTTSYSYADNYSSGVPPGPTNAYLTQVTHPQTNGVSHIESFKYAYASGEVTSSTDMNNQTTTYKYVDNLARLTEIDYPTPDGGITTNTYTDTPNAVKVETKHKIDATRWTDSFVLYDGLMQPIVRSAANGETTPWDRTDTCYDGMGRVRFSSYAYQASSGTSAPNCTTGVGDTFTYDALGRVTQLAHSDGTTVLTSYTGRATQVQDEGNGTRRVVRLSQPDGLGRLLSICEATSVTQLGNGGTPAACGQDIAATGFLTTYAYNARGDLLTVTQNGLNQRTFNYDFLSRLTSATNPESGAINYSYDSDANCVSPNSFAGLLVSKTDARGVRTCYQYDALYHLTQKNYSDGTPTASYNYDQTLAYGVSLLNTNGRLSSQSTASPDPTGEVFSYDQLGRVKINSQCTPQNCATPAVFPVTYTYDLLGNTLTSTNGAGVTLTYAVNSATRLTTLTSSLSDANHPGTLFSVAHYNPAGSLLSASLGNGVNETRTYDSRLRLATIADGSNYSLSIPSSTGYAPNSDILAANDSGNGNWTYSYDDFNRILGSNKNAGAEIYSYDYDRFGNRWHQNGPHTMMLSFSASNNRMDGYSYDLAGNLLSDGTHSYTYNAENRIAKVDNGSTATYIYGADGQRVRKTTASGSVDFLYDLAGHEITELSSAGAWNRGEVYAGGRHLATYKNGISGPMYFLYADWLGTERIRTDKSGVNCETIVSLPFGDWQTTSGSCGDPSPMHFTGKERDSESGLDNFGARYNSSSLGRFMSPDPGNISGFLYQTDPQSWNGHAYARNNPLKYTDPDGDVYQICIQGEKECTDVSDEEFAKLQKDPGAGISLRNGDIYATDANGKQVKVGTYNQTDVDLPPGAAATLALAGAMAEPGVNLAANGLRTFGYVVAAPMMVAAECARVRLPAPRAMLRWQSSQASASSARARRSLKRERLRERARKSSKRAVAWLRPLRILRA